MRATQRVAVLGAGLQGVCIALELARRGITVDLVEQDAQPLNRASLRNEGKIHLGLVYAKDATFATAETMLDGALDFRRLLSSWTAGRFDAVARSRPFVYLVARDTLLPPPVLAAHYAAVATSYRARLAADPGLDYLGTRTDDVWRRLEEPAFAALGAPAQAIAAFETIEAAIDLGDVVG